MTKYFISVSAEESVWRLDPRDFIAVLKRRWPEAVILDGQPDDEGWVWFKMEPGPGHGYIYAHFQGKDSVVVEMVDDLRDIATIAIWFRSLVPESIPTLLYDEGYNEHFPVTPSMTEKELAAVFLPE